LRLCISAKFRGPYHSQSKESPTDKFRQLEEVLPTPNEYRTATGAPGHKYWQQRADYNIKVEVDDENQRIIGSETIDYHNVSPDTLTYLWLQLDQNIFERHSDANITRTASDFKTLPFAAAAAPLRDSFGMDEGLNSFLQYLAEQEWETNCPSRRGEPKYIPAYMTSSLQEPIMTNSDSILQRRRRPAWCGRKRREWGV
jgi:hypothetical protein